MKQAQTMGSRWALGVALLVPAVVALAAPGGASAQAASTVRLAADAPVTFTKDIAPILQRSCMGCHRPGGVAPMSLTTYEEVRPWARAVQYRTSLRDKMGAMPPWYIEKDIGIQHYKNDPSLSDAEVAAIAAWVAAGAPQGDPADLPPLPEFTDEAVWSMGEPDLVIETEEIFVKGGAPDWWGEIPSVDTGLTEDRYVASVEIREVNDVGQNGQGRETVGGRYIVHHMIWRTEAPVAEGAQPGDDDVVSWPVHEVGRNPDIFDPAAGRLLKAGSKIVSESVHLHSNGIDTRGKLQIGFRFHPKGYQPKYRPASVALGNGVDIDIRGDQAGQELHAYAVLDQHTKIITFEPHLHAPGARMCLEAIWGINIETLSCAGYDHNWVRGYAFEDGYQPILPKGTVLHIVGFMDNSETNQNVPDPRNWQGSGNRSVTNMFIDLGMRVTLTEEQFQEEMALRREKHQLTKNDHLIGCPLCLVPIPTPDPRSGVPVASAQD